MRDSVVQHSPRMVRAQWGPGGGTLLHPVSRHDHYSMAVKICGRLAAVVLLALALGLLDGEASGMVTAYGSPSGGSLWPHPLSNVPFTVHLADAGGPVVGHLTTGPNGQLSMRLRPGRYVLTPPRGWVCAATVVVVPFRHITAYPVCSRSG